MGFEFVETERTRKEKENKICNAWRKDRVLSGNREQEKVNKNNKKNKK